MVNQSTSKLQQVGKRRISDRWKTQKEIIYLYNYLSPHEDIEMEVMVTETWSQDQR